MKFDSAAVQEFLLLNKESHQKLFEGEGEDWSAPLYFNGALSEEQAENLCTRAEAVLNEHVSSKSQRKRLFVTFVEAIQNSRKHAIRAEDDNTPAETAILINSKEHLLRIRTRNIISQASRQILQERCDAINALEFDEMKQLYMQTMANGEFSDSGGAGLGLITIAVRAKSRLQFQFIPLSENLLIFELNVTVSLAE